MRIGLETTAGLIIDLQERLVPHMHEHEQLLQRCSVLIKGLTILGVPMLHTEQYPAGLGTTVTAIGSLFAGTPAIEKRSFSCCDEPALFAQLQQTGRAAVLVAGIESHVCILQTVIDLQVAGFAPVIIADAVSSRREFDKKIALKRMAAEGCRISTVESVLFELMRTSRHDRFREVSRLVK
jgi:nicotinamidase-related amidase